jgi:hypothetical protein
MRHGQAHAAYIAGFSLLDEVPDIFGLYAPGFVLEIIIYS